MSVGGRETNQAVEGHLEVSGRGDFIESAQGRPHREISFGQRLKERSGQAVQPRRGTALWAEGTEVLGEHGGGQGGWRRGHNK